MNAGGWVAVGTPLPGTPAQIQDGVRAGQGQLLFFCTKEWILLQWYAVFGSNFYTLCIIELLAGNTRDDIFFDERDLMGARNADRKI